MFKHLENLADAKAELVWFLNLRDDAQIDYINNPNEDTIQAVIGIDRYIYALRELIALNESRIFTCKRA